MGLSRRIHGLGGMDGFGAGDEGGISIGVGLYRTK